MDTLTLNPAIAAEGLDAVNAAASAAANQPKISVLDVLRAKKAEMNGTDDFELPVTGVTVTVPKFKPYATWQKAQRFADGNSDVMQVIYLLEVCTFNGERLTRGDYADLIPADDHAFILSRVLGARPDAAKDDKAAPGN